MNVHPARIALLALSTLAISACVSSPASSNYGHGGGYNGSYNNGYHNGYGSRYQCSECGTVTRIEVVGGSQVPVGTGAVIGGIVGAVAAREIAKDNTDSQRRRNVAAAAGAAGGALVGNAIQERAAASRYNVYVRMDDGREVMVSQTDLYGIQQGTAVRVQNGRVYAR
ncbi:peptidoglycan-associated outer membrane lipoprotein precursor [Lysobacteraceae bacterium NML120232]|nr:peptidoglycan-associated outer membrane lipoprotein precursor [Xanthomonadaceae bacterium NML120232]